MARTTKTFLGGFQQYLSKKFAALAGVLYAMYLVWEAYAEMCEANIPLLEWPTAMFFLGISIMTSVYFVSQTWPDVARIRKESEVTSGEGS